MAALNEMPWWPELLRRLQREPAAKLAEEYGVGLEELDAALVASSHGGAAEEEPWWPEVLREHERGSLRELARRFRTNPRRLRRALARQGLRAGGRPLPPEGNPALQPFLDRLGREPDASIAADAGVTTEAVQGERRRLGIPPYRGGAPGRQELGVSRLRESFKPLETSHGTVEVIHLDRRWSPPREKLSARGQHPRGRDIASLLASKAEKGERSLPREASPSSARRPACEAERRRLASRLSLAGRLPRLGASPPPASSTQNEKLGAPQSPRPRRRYVRPAGEGLAGRGEEALEKLPPTPRGSPPPARPPLQKPAPPKPPPASSGSRPTPAGRRRPAAAKSHPGAGRVRMARGGKHRDAAPAPLKAPPKPYTRPLAGWWIEPEGHAPLLLLAPDLAAALAAAREHLGPAASLRRARARRLGPLLGPPGPGEP